MQISGQKKKKASATATGAPAAPSTGPSASQWAAQAGANHVLQDAQRQATSTPPPEATTSKTTTSTTSTGTVAFRQEADGRPQKTRPEIITDSYIPMMEPELAAQATFDLRALQQDMDTVLPQFRATLDQLGFAVVSNIFDPDTTAQMEQLWAQDLQGIIESSVHKHDKRMAFAKDPLTKWPWEDEQFSLGTKFASFYGLPQGQCAWSVRSHPNVKFVYECLYNTDKLCCGTDNVFFNPRNSSVGTESERMSNLWPHADQNGNLAPHGKYDVWQSIVYLWPADSNTSATVVHPCSNHAEFDRLMQWTSARGHFCMLPKTEFGEFAQVARRVPVPAGGMLLWNSRTIHQGWPHGKRLAIPVCFEPTKRRDDKTLKAKVQAVETGQPTSHWASLGKIHSLAARSYADGGSDDIRLKHRAHAHCLDSTGAVKPEILKFL